MQLIPFLIAITIFASVFLLLMVFSGQLTPILNLLVGRYRQELEQQFELLHLSFSPNQYMMFQTGLILALFSIGLVSGPDLLTKVTIGLFFALGGFLLSRRYIADRHKQRKERFQEQFADAAALIGNSVRSGLSLFQALEVIVREMDDPISYEVRQVLQATKVGAPLENVLEDWSQRMQSPDLDIFVTAINIQRQTGGDLSHVLSTLGNTIRQRQKIQGQIQALTAQGRLSAYILSGLPVFMGIVLYFLNPERMGLMVTHPIGWSMMGVSAVTILLGVVVVRKIVEIDI